MPATVSRAALSQRDDRSRLRAWAHEVGVENRIKGDAIFFELTGKF
jgi:hypothetical protein